MAGLCRGEITFAKRSRPAAAARLRNPGCLSLDANTLGLVGEPISVSTALLGVGMGPRDRQVSQSLHHFAITY